MAGKMAADTEGCGEYFWHKILQDDIQLWTSIQLPVYTTDIMFIALLQKVKETVQDLDCTDCCQLTPDTFSQLANLPIRLSQLRILVVPNNLVLANAVFESMALAGCFPVLQQLVNIQSSSVCDPIRCQAYFKLSKLCLLTDSPVMEYGRARRLLLQDSADHKQRRQHWEADLAKAAISCTHIDTYRCSRGVGYIDDRSFERLSVLFPRLSHVELGCCSITDEGLTRFFVHNRSAVSGLVELVLDKPGTLTDVSLHTIATYCPQLRILSLSHCTSFTNDSIRLLISKCEQLQELCFNIQETSIDNVTVQTIGKHCKQLRELKLFNCSAVSSTGVSALVSQCEHLNTLLLHSCHGFDDYCLSLVAQHCHQLSDFSVYSKAVSAQALLGFIMHCHSLRKLHIQGSALLQTAKLSELAEDTYNLLSNDVTCRSSEIKSLKLISVCQTFLRLVTVLCSKVVSLHIGDLKLDVVPDASNVLVHCIETCSLLKTLDLSTVTNITDHFLAVVCERGLELRQLSIFFGRHVTNELIAGLIEISPSLSTLIVTLPCDEQQDQLESRRFDEDYLVDVANRFHRRTCYLRVHNVSPSCHRQLQFELSFVPLKYMHAMAMSDFFVD